MDSNHINFFVSYGVAFIAFTLIARWYVWEALVAREPRAALSPLLLYACLRVNGLMFLMPGLVSPDLPPAFAQPVAYGDLTAAVLALIGLAALRYEHPAAVPLVWLFNLVGTADLLYANVSSLKDGVDPVALGAAYYLAVVNVPAMMVVHMLIFLYLWRRRRAPETSGRLNASEP
jgi:hypothetical protein